MRRTQGFATMNITRPVGTFVVLLVAVTASATEPIEIGSRLELLVDTHLIDEMSEGAELEMHHPVPQEISLVHDAPWEGSGTGYHSVFRDGELYRMYYKAWQISVEDGKLNTGAHPLFTCYAESRDGIRWEKPNLGLVEFRGSK